MEYEKPEGSHNLRLTNQLPTEKWGGHCASFVAMLCSLHSTTNFFAVNLGHFGKYNEKDDKGQWETILRYCKLHLLLWAKRTGTQKCSTMMPTVVGKGMFWDKAMLNSEKIKPVALSIIELCFAEGIS